LGGRVEKCEQLHVGLAEFGRVDDLERYKHTFDFISNHTFYEMLFGIFASLTPE